MSGKIGLNGLRRVAILYEGDFFDLASFMLKVCTARDRGTTTVLRPTVHGISSAYAHVTQTDLEVVENTIAKHALDLGAVVDFDES